MDLQCVLVNTGREHQKHLMKTAIFTNKGSLANQSLKFSSVKIINVNNINNRATFYYRVIGRLKYNMCPQLTNSNLSQIYPEMLQRNDVKHHFFHLLVIFNTVKKMVCYHYVRKYFYTTAYTYLIMQKLGSFDIIIYGQ